MKTYYTAIYDQGSIKTFDNLDEFNWYLDNMEVEHGYNFEYVRTDYFPDATFKIYKDEISRA